MVIPGSVVKAAAPAATKISIPKKITVNVGKKKKLKVTSTPKSAKPKIQWKTSNVKVATVSKKGIVKGVKAGKVTVKAMVKGTKISAKCTVTVKNILAKSVTVSPTTAGLKAGETIQLSVTVKPNNTTNKAVTYSSSNPSVATVSSVGVVKAVKKGSATITVTTKDGSKKSATLKVTVDPVSATALNATMPKTELIQGDKIQVNTSVLPANASVKEFKYTSSDPYAATVSNTGLVTAITKGSAKIIVETVDGSGLKAEIDIFVNYHIEENETKVRTIITTDWEQDDMNSLVRLYLYSNEYDLEGIILGSSRFHWAGVPELGVPESQWVVPPYQWPGTDLFKDYEDRYEQIYSNLIVHDPDYPTPNYMRSIFYLGNIMQEGEMEVDTEGSNAIKKAILDDDPRPLHLQVWGGCNTISRALKSIEDEYKDTPRWSAILQRINSKVTIYNILDQDITMTNYIRPNWPGIRLINDSDNFWSFAYNWKQRSNPGELYTLEAPWMKEHTKFNHGALLEIYRLVGDGMYTPGESDGRQAGGDGTVGSAPYNWDRLDFLSEGDSPSFIYIIDRGLRSMENYSYGGWAGRFGPHATIANQVTDNVQDYDTVRNRWHKWWTIQRWINDVQNDFGARADWCIASKYEDANHMPTLRIKQGTDFTAAPSEMVSFTALASDPDGDKLTMSWWQYHEVDTYQEKVDENGVPVPILINGAAAHGTSAFISVPEDAKNGDTIHIIAQVTDDGNGTEHKLNYYQRIIITVEGRQEIGAIEINKAVGVTDTINRTDSNALRTLKTVIKDATGTVITGKTITWSSSDTSKATIASNGRITILSGATGQVTFTAMANDGSGKSDQITLTVVG